MSSKTNREKRREAKKKTRERRVRREVYAGPNGKGGGSPTRRGGLWGKGKRWDVPAWSG